jgi:hypothetical protein
MKKNIILTILFAMIGSTSFSQIVFEDGYFINDSNQTIHCLIKNVDWKNNPFKFEYKMSPGDAVHTADIQQVKEFGIAGISKYVRATVNIDRSSDEIKDLSTQRNPIFHQEQLFLKVLIEGKASLFFFKDESLTRFFYKTDDSAINQLVYKRYITNGNMIAQNNKFRQQLLFALRCKGIGRQNVEYLRYSKREIEKLFLIYNQSAGSDYVNYESKQDKDLFHLSIRPGVNFSSLAIDDYLSSLRSADFGNNLNLRLGIEAEYIFPFNRNKWGLIIEPTYQSFKAKSIKEASTVVGGKILENVDYKSIEWPMGIRHYFFLNDKSKIFLNVSYNIDFFSLGSKIKITRNDGSVLYSLDINPNRNLVFGAGYKFKNKYSVELRYYTKREILRYVYWSSDYKTIAIMFGYTLF